MSEMSCNTARAALLEADVAELRGEQGSELARHIAECPACATMAARLLQGYRDLDAGLAGLESPRSRRALRRSPAWAAVPLAAAALAVFLLMPRDNQLPAPSPLLVRLLFPDAPVVTPPAGTQAVVLEQNDLTVVWLYNETGEQQ